jgi:hypothetical protein
MLLVVATFNCCIPTTFASYNDATHQVVQNLDSTNHPNTTSQHCPSQEKPDLDIVQSASSSLEDIQGQIQHKPLTKFLNYRPSKKIDHKQGSNNKNQNIVSKLWGASSEFSSSVFRL